MHNKAIISKLPDIETYIGHKISVERYDPDSLPKLLPAPYVPRDPDAPMRRPRSGGGGRRVPPPRRR